MTGVSGYRFIDLMYSKLCAVPIELLSSLALREDRYFDDAKEGPMSEIDILAKNLLWIKYNTEIL